MEKFKLHTIDDQINISAVDEKATPESPTTSSPKKFRFGKVAIYIVIIIIIAIFVFTSQILFTGNSTSEGGTFSFLKQLTTIAKGNGDLKGAEEDRINILLLGIGGAGHDGPNLTDTIIIASIQPSTKKIAMISIPRDLLVEVPDKGNWKVNSVYHFGQQNDSHGGELSSQVISEITDIPIHYYFRVDFNGFEDIIDELGGIKLYVDQSFVDYQFPTEDYKYQVVSFEEGWQTMDGETALNYVRSRHGNNGEGSDFARSARQQKVLQAVKERVLSLKTLLNFKKISTIIDTLQEHIDTNLEASELVELAKLAKELDTENMITQVIDDGPNGFLYSTFYNEAYVLRPHLNSYTEIQFMAKNIFTSQHTIVQKKSANLEIKNGTPTNGLAYNASVKMKELGFKVLKIGNAPQQDYQQTIIYSLHKDNDEEIIKTLETQFQSAVIFEVPEAVMEDADFSTDFYIILGDKTQ